jgi:hypothetical protein
VRLSICSRSRVILLAFLSGLALSGCAAPAATQDEGSAARPPAAATGPSTTPSATPGPSVGPTGAAADLLAGIAVKGRAAKTGYERAAFGPAWADADRNGCDTRNDILRRDLTQVSIRPSTRGCVVVAGLLSDPYTGRSMNFAKSHASSVQIDHVVALSNAWQSGAAQWPAAKRVAFANDPINLLAVEGAVNQAKGDGDAATWLPPRKVYRCAYVARQIAVKHEYGLWVTGAENAAMSRILQACPGQGVPAGPAAPISPISPVSPVEPAPDPAAAKAPAPVGTAAPRAAGMLDPRFPSCAQARQSGYGGYVRGQDPEFDWYRDGDQDGVVCE